MGEIPCWVTVVALDCALIAVIAFAMSIMLSASGAAVGSPDDLATKSLMLPPYIVWLTALGALGSIAFIGMNVLSVQEDATFDLTNERLMILRIALGGLFGLILGLPFG